MLIRTCSETSNTMLRFFRGALNFYTRDKLMDNTKVKALFMLILASALVAISAVAQAGMESGIAAYNKGDYPAALNVLQPLATKGNATAQLYLGRMYTKGMGLSPDYNKAIFWTRKAAERKNVEAQYFLGFLHHYGLGTPQDYREAMLWYHKAAELGNTKAQASLGSMFASGQGVPQDLVLAYKWFKLAASLGETDTLVKLRAIEEDMDPQQIKEAQALAQKWLEKRK